MDKHIGAEIGCTNFKIKREIEKLVSIHNIDDINGVNSKIMMFIRNNTKPIYQKDIEKKFGITRATASNIISLMEKKNLVERKKDLVDNRLKQLLLTEKAKSFIDEIINDLEFIEAKIKKGFSDSELELFFSFLDRIKNNLGGEQND